AQTRTHGSDTRYQRSAIRVDVDAPLLATAQPFDDLREFPALFRKHSLDAAAFEIDRAETQRREAHAFGDVLDHRFMTHRAHRGPGRIPEMLGERLLTITLQGNPASQSGEIMRRNPFQLRIVFYCGGKRAGVQLPRGHTFGYTVDVVAQFVQYASGHR